MKKWGFLYQYYILIESFCKIKDQVLWWSFSFFVFIIKFFSLRKPYIELINFSSIKSFFFSFVISTLVSWFYKFRQLNILISIFPLKVYSKLIQFIIEHNLLPTEDIMQVAFWLKELGDLLTLYTFQRIKVICIFLLKNSLVS